MPNRKFDAGSEYRYGFNGKEVDKSTGEGNLDFGARILNVRLGRWLSVDPLQQKFPNESPYSYVGCSPIGMIDPDGKVKYIVHLQYDANTGKYLLLKIEKSRGLKKKVRIEREQSCNSCGNTNVEYTDWYNYQTFKITVINGKPGAKYDIKIPDRIIDEKRTTTSYFNFETVAQIKSGDLSFGDGGIVFTSYDPGLKRTDLERNPEFMSNIYGLLAAMGGISGGGPKELEKLVESGDFWKTVENYVGILPEATVKGTGVAKDLLDGNIQPPVKGNPIDLGQAPPYSKYIRDNNGRLIHSAETLGRADTIIKGKNGDPDTLKKQIYTIKPPIPAKDIKGN